MKLTPWFVNGEKPARDGVYQVSWKKNDQDAHTYAFWSKKNGWGGSSGRDSCLALRSAGRDPKFFSDTGSWRGLAKEPKQ